MFPTCCGVNSENWKLQFIHKAVQQISELMVIAYKNVYCSKGIPLEHSQKQCDTLNFIKFIVFGKNSIKHPKVTKCHQNFDMFGNMLLRINAETFFQKNVAKIEVTCRNKGIPMNWHIFVPSTVRALIIHILPPKTFSLNISEILPKICKIVVYFKVTSSRNIFLQKN